MKFIVVEIGSTNTKAKIFDNGIITDLGFTTIEFKANFKKENKIASSDKNLLFAYLEKLKKETPNIYVYGTSVFRNLNATDKNNWLEEFKNNTDLDFNIVTSKEENRYTSYGAYDASYKGSIAIMIAGGASTELAIYNEGKLVEEKFYNFGVTNALELFPDLKCDIATSKIEVMLNKMQELVDDIPTNKADILVLAGGDFIYFYEEANYPLQTNKFYKNEKEPYLIDLENMDLYDKKFFYETSLDEICIKTGREGWWRGTRGMRLCVKTICNLLDVKYIVPTRINMLDGIIASIISDKER